MLLRLWHTGELQHKQQQGVLYMSSRLVPLCCLLSQDILLLFSANDSWACAGLAQLTDQYASDYVQHQSPENCILLY